MSVNENVFSCILSKLFLPYKRGVLTLISMNRKHNTNTNVSRIPAALKDDSCTWWGIRNSTQLPWDHVSVISFCLFHSRFLANEHICTRQFREAGMGRQAFKDFQALGDLREPFEEWCRIFIVCWKEEEITSVENLYLLHQVIFDETSTTKCPIIFSNTFKSAMYRIRWKHPQRDWRDRRSHPEATFLCLEWLSALGTVIYG